MMRVKAKKALGQHFLRDLSIAERIADTLSEYKALPVLEIGPGMGVLTQFLLRKGHDVRVIEIDGESVSYLRAEFPELSDRIIEGDFLHYPLSELFPGGRQYCLIGNYPYNISSQIFFRLLDVREQIPCCSGMLQREVAMRLASPPGKKDYGILSVLLQLWYDIEYLFTVDASVFDPPPKVQSGVIRLTRNDRKELPCSEKALKTVVKTAFGQRRKTLRNSLRGILPVGFDRFDDPVFSKRPEQLSPDDFVALTLLLQQ